MRQMEGRRQNYLQSVERVLSRVERSRHAERRGEERVESPARSVLRAQFRESPDEQENKRA
jgi:hypothetical protein